MKPESAGKQYASLPILLKDIRACRLCAAHLPHGVRPILQISTTARILIVGQAPGRRVHESGVPFDDASGERLRQWMGISAHVFYDASTIAILPMGFCYPGTGKSGDLPPRPECAPTWREAVLAHMPNIELTLVVGQYAMNWHMKNSAFNTLTEKVKNWREQWPTILPLPHPSPRNNIWLKANPWFAKEVVPALQTRIESLLRKP